MSGWRPLWQSYHSTADVYERFDFSVCCKRFPDTAKSTSIGEWKEAFKSSILATSHISVCYVKTIFLLRVCSLRGFFVRDSGAEDALIVGGELWCDEIHGRQHTFELVYCEGNQIVFSGNQRSRPSWSCDQRMDQHVTAFRNVGWYRHALA